MGNRANFVVVKNQDWGLYHSHWAGCRIFDALIGGPDFALRYAQTLRPCPKDQWVDPVWADGGAVVDFDRRRLLFFGDELMVAMAERRALMGVLAVVWPGYAIGGHMTEPSNWRDMWERSCQLTRGIGSQSFGSPATETRCAILFLLSTTRDNFGCGRCGGTSARRGTGPHW
jgi:hypothetical protein